MLLKRSLKTRYPSATETQHVHIIDCFAHIRCGDRHKPGPPPGRGQRVRSTAILYLQQEYRVGKISRFGGRDRTQAPEFSKQNRHNDERVMAAVRLNEHSNKRLTSSRTNENVRSTVRACQNHTLKGLRRTKKLESGGKSQSCCADRMPLRVR